MIDWSKPRFTRGHTDDEPFWAACFTYNEYHVTEFEPDGLVVDLGVNIGMFSAKAYACGARNIIGAEIDGECHSVACQNLLETGAVIHHVAVVSPENDSGSTAYRANTLSRFVDANSEVAIATTTLDKLVGDNAVQFLKIDVEGSEWEILYTATCLDRVKEIAGEYHEPCPTWSLLHQKDGLPAFTAATLEVFLRERGFETEFFFPVESYPIKSGPFWAWRGERTTTWSWPAA